MPKPCSGELNDYLHKTTNNKNNLKSISLARLSLPYTLKSIFFLKKTRLVRILETTVARVCVHPLRVLAHFKFS